MNQSYNRLDEELEDENNNYDSRGEQEARQGSESNCNNHEDEEKEYEKEGEEEKKEETEEEPEEQKVIKSEDQLQDEEEEEEEEESDNDEEDYDYDYDENNSNDDKDEDDDGGNGNNDKKNEKTKIAEGKKEEEKEKENEKVKNLELENKEGEEDKEKQDNSIDFITKQSFFDISDKVIEMVKLKKYKEKSKRYDLLIDENASNKAGGKSGIDDAMFKRKAMRYFAYFIYLLIIALIVATCFKFLVLRGSLLSNPRANLLLNIDNCTLFIQDKPKSSNIKRPVYANYHLPIEFDSDIITKVMMNSSSDPQTLEVKNKKESAYCLIELFIEPNTLLGSLEINCPHCNITPCISLRRCNFLKISSFIFKKFCLISFLSSFMALIISSISSGSN